MENNNLENNILENNNVVIPKRGRPRKFEEQTAKDRNKEKMQELRESGYFKEYYQKRKTIKQCTICKANTTDFSLNKHQRSRFCKSIKLLNDQALKLDDELIENKPKDEIKNNSNQPKLIKETIICIKEYELINQTD